MKNKSKSVVGIEDIPRLPSFPSTPFDVIIHLTDGTETIKVMARGPAHAWITALHTVQRWPEDKIAKLKSMEHTVPVRR